MHQDPYLQLETLEQQKAYYEQQGYLVVRKLIPSEICDRIVNTFESEVKPYPGYIYRQTSSLPERHQLSEFGYIMNSIKHLQDLDPKQFSSFIQSSFEGIAHSQVVQLIKALLQDDSVIVQTMMFEGNPVTPPHVDSYYLDSANNGKMVAMWMALEDIQPGAGRFFIYPGSHQVPLPPNEGEYEISFHHRNYLNAIRDITRQPGMECRAPALKKGDVLFWNANTIHGSLPTSTPEFSRRSLTAHFIPASHDYVLFQKVKVSLALKEFNGIPVHCPKDPSQWSNRLQMFGLRHFPKATHYARQSLIHLRMRQRVSSP